MRSGVLGAGVGDTRPGPADPAAAIEDGQMPDHSAPVASGVPSQVGQRWLMAGQDDTSFGVDPDAQDVHQVAAARRQVGSQHGALDLKPRRHWRR